MACYPTHCTFNCFSDNCVLNAPTCPTNETNFGAAVIIGDIILASHTNTLRASIDEERVRRGYAEDFSTTVDSDDDIEQQHMVDMKNSINEIGGGVTNTYSDLIYAAELNDLRTEINDLRIVCQCDGDCG